MHSTSLAAGRRCPGFAFALAVAVVSDLASAVEEPPVEYRGANAASCKKSRRFMIFSSNIFSNICKHYPGKRNEPYAGLLYYHGEWASVYNK